MDGDARTVDTIVPISGRRLILPAAPVFKLRRAAQLHYALGEFRAWAGYKNYGSDAATGNLAHFQHVLTFAGTNGAGRTGVHAHLAHAHVIIPTSGRGVFSYDGVITEAVPGSVIVQHGGTVHDQFDYSFSGASEAVNRLTPLSIDPPPAKGPRLSFGFLELFVPKVFANVEIVPPGEVTDEDQRTAWDHPYHAAGARFHLQRSDAPGAAWRPVAGLPYLEARDCGTWAASGRLVATWFVRAAGEGAASPPPVELGVPGECGGVEILYMVAGAARSERIDGVGLTLNAGDALTFAQGIVGAPYDCTPDMRLIRFFIAARAQDLRERTPEEIARLEALGPAIITRREPRPDGDARPVNLFQGPLRP